MSTTDHDLAIAAAQAGAAIARSAHGSALTHFDKGAGDFATEADIASEKAIVDIIRTDRPGDAVVGEEFGRTGPDEAERVWLVDPLCGTLNYAARTTLVAVNVALRVGSKLTAAAVADPFTGEIFWTDGTHAHLRRDGVDEPLVPSGSSRLVDMNLEPPFPNDPGFHVFRLLADEGFNARFRPRVVSTSLAVAWVAAGRRAGYVTDGQRLDSVHFAGGIALCQAAGAIVTGLRGQPYHTGVSGLIIAADQDTHAALLALVDAQFSASQHS